MKKQKSTIFQQSKAFTLAEVLITLMIIGIIASIVIPSLMQTLEKNALKGQIKRELAILEEALKLTLLDNDYKCFYEYKNGVWVGTSRSDCPDFFNKFYTKLKIMRFCKGNSLAQGCIPQYSGLLESYASCPEFSKNKVNTTNYSRVLIDGTIIMQLAIDNYPLIAVDVNGMKPPNIQGRDVIVLRIDKDVNTEKISIISSGIGLNSCSTAFGSAVDRYFNTVQDLYK